MKKMKLRVLILCCIASVILSSCSAKGIADNNTTSVTTSNQTTAGTTDDTVGKKVETDVYFNIDESYSTESVGPIDEEFTAIIQGKQEELEFVESTVPTELPDEDTIQVGEFWLEQDVYPAVKVYGNSAIELFESGRLAMEGSPTSAVTWNETLALGMFITKEGKVVMGAASSRTNTMFVAYVQYDDDMERFIRTAEFIPYRPDNMSNASICLLLVTKETGAAAIFTAVENSDSDSDFNPLMLLSPQYYYLTYYEDGKLCRYTTVTDEGRKLYLTKRVNGDTVEYVYSKMSLDSEAGGSITETVYLANEVTTEYVTWNEETGEFEFEDK